MSAGEEESFGVYVAGEQIEGVAGIGYVRVTTPIGDLRMTEEEAESLGRRLVHAASLYASDKGP